MRLTYSRALFLGLLLLFVVASLRPSARIEAALAVPLAPLRLLAEVSAPLRLLFRSEVRAAREGLAALAEEEHRESLRLVEEERGAALPAAPHLRAGRRFHHVQVLGPGRAPDVLRAAPDRGDTTGLELGMPVVRGEVFVGRLASVDPERGEVEVRLVTGRDNFVGAATLLGGQRVRMVVGGVVPLAGDGAAGDSYGLGVHNPERRVGLGGLVYVAEPERADEPFAEEAHGFALGVLVPAGEGWAVRPLVDYKDGLFELAVVAPRRGPVAPTPAPEHVLGDGRWVAARVLAPGEPSRGRRGLRIGAGRAAGVREGAAVVHGTRLVGRVVRAGWFDASVALLGDPGLSLPAVARLEDGGSLVLGRVIARGSVQEGERYLWRQRTGTPLDAPLEATLFTGSGDPGLPRGLCLGRATLPAGLGPHELVLRQGADLGRIDRVHVRLEADGPGTGKEDGGP